MSLLPTRSAAAEDAAQHDAEVLQLLSAFYVIAQSVSAAMAAITHAGLLEQPLLPHYRQRLIMAKLDLLSLPYAQTADSSVESHACLAQLAADQPPPHILLRLASDPRRFERMTRISVAEFLQLYAELKADILRPRPAKKGRHAGGRTRVLHPADEFLLWVWHCDGTDADILGFLFNGISRWTATRIADHVNDAVLRVWEEEVSWPDAEERRLLYGFFTSCEKAVGVLDGTHCQISVPYFKEERSMSGYKKLHTQNYIVCADALGFVIYTAGPFEGMANDRAALNTTPFVRPDCPLLSEGEVILTDGGFQGDGAILHQFTQNELAKLSPEQRAEAGLWNEDFLYNRTAIEHCIHRIKCRTQALTTRWQREPLKQAELFQSSCRFYNRLRRLRMQYAWGQRSV